MKVTLNNKQILENVLFAGDIIRYTILEDDIVSIKLVLSLLMKKIMNLI